MAPFIWMWNILQQGRNIKHFKSPPIIQPGDHTFLTHSTGTSALSPRFRATASSHHLSTLDQGCKTVFTPQILLQLHKFTLAEDPQCCSPHFSYRISFFNASQGVMGSHHPSKHHFLSGVYGIYRPGPFYTGCWWVWGTRKGKQGLIAPKRRENHQKVNSA